jgi:hypothetical protein
MINIIKQIIPAVGTCIIKFDPLLDAVLMKQVFADYQRDIFGWGERCEADGAVLPRQLLSVGCGDDIFLHHLFYFFGP